MILKKSTKTKKSERKKQQALISLFFLNIFGGMGCQKYLKHVICFQVFLSRKARRPVSV